MHHSEAPLLIANPWDAGSAKLLETLGFSALATTSGGYAATLGRGDGNVTRGEALAHARAVCAATDLPVSADLEDGYGATPEDVVTTVRGARSAGLAGCSIEDSTRDPDNPIHPFDLAVERVTAAVEEAHSGDVRLVLTARTENYVRGRVDLDDTIARLVAFERAGADVLFATGVIAPIELTAILDAVTVPINVLALPGAPSVGDLAALGVRRVSFGSALLWSAFGGVVDAVREIQEHGTYGFMGAAAAGRAAVLPALTSR